MNSISIVTELGSLKITSDGTPTLLLPTGEQIEIDKQRLLEALKKTNESTTIKRNER